MNNSRIERNVGILMALTLLAVSIGGMAEIFPLVFEQSGTKPIETLRPYTAVQLEGRDIYMREGCAVCHTQMVRPLQSETARYGHYSVAGEDSYEHPFLWGSKRTGPNLARVGGRYSDDWHRAHLADPRSVVPVSNMPGYGWLFEASIEGKDTAVPQCLPPGAFRIVLGRLGLAELNGQVTAGCLESRVGTLRLDRHPRAHRRPRHKQEPDHGRHAQAHAVPTRVLPNPVERSGCGGADRFVRKVATDVLG